MCHSASPRGTAGAAGAGASTHVAGVDRALLGEVLRQQGYVATPDGNGFRVAASPSDVSRAALAHQVVLTELRDGTAGLEDLFLELTSATQRDGGSASRTDRTGAAA